MDIAREIRRLVRQGKYVISQHADERMGLRHVGHDDLESVILFGEVIEQRLDNKPDPKLLFMGMVAGEPVYVSCAFSGRKVHIVTVHRFDPARWIDPVTRRKD